MRGAWLAACAAAASCTGGDGTVTVSLTTAPGSSVLAGATTLRVTITEPKTVREAARGSDGSFDLELDFDAIGSDGAIIVEGLDGSGATLAVGESPPFPLAAVTFGVVIYMAAPRSFGAAPLALDAARDGITVVPVAFGGILAGGRDATGSASNELHAYNAFDHTFAAGSALPAPRSDMAGAAGTVTGDVYFFGGLDAAGSATGTLWGFNPQVAPSGVYADLGTHAELARAGQAMVPDGLETFVVTGAPALDLVGTGSSATLAARGNLPDAPPEAAVTVGSDETDTVLFAGSGGVSRLRAGSASALAIAGGARTDHAVVALAGGKVAIVGGALAGTPTRDAILVDAVAGTATTVTGALSTARLDAATAATPRYVVVAGGTDGAGAVLATADLLDATTLALVATIPMVVGRTGAAALALPNEQVLIVGGRDGSGAPSAILELFTPDAPP